MPLTKGLSTSLLPSIDDAGRTNDETFGTGDIFHSAVSRKGFAPQHDTAEPFYTAEAETPERNYFRYDGIPTDHFPRR